MEDTAVRYPPGKTQGKDNGKGQKDGMGAQIYREGESSNGKKLGGAADPSNSLGCAV